MFSRRDFLRTSALATGAAFAPWPSAFGQSPDLRPVATTAPTANLVTGRKVRVAAVGLGGKGYSDLRALDSEELVGLCDVDFERGAQAFYDFQDVPRYRDFRRMFDELHDRIDAVTIATPDHMHFAVALMAIERGKHVYVQKPLTHTIGEARALKAAAARTGVATQMGNQGHANEGTRLAREWIEADVIGEVREVIAWTNRPVWPQGIAWPDGAGVTPPSTLDWNLWLGVAPHRAYRPGLAPFNWRGMWDYGTGALGDMACHLLDAPFWALDLRGDVKITSEADGGSAITAPNGSVVRYEFPKRGNLPPVVLTWLDGTRKPASLPELADATNPDGSPAAMPRGGVLYRGTKGAILSPTDYGESPRLLPESRMAEFQRPPRVYARVPRANPHLEWISAIKGGPVPGSNIIDHSADLTEMVLLGNLALRLGRPIDWDAKTGTCRGLPEANALINKTYRLF